MANIAPNNAPVNGSNHVSNHDTPGNGAPSIPNIALNNAAADANNAPHAPANPDVSADTRTGASADDGDDEAHEEAHEETQAEESWQLVSGPLSKEARMEAQMLGAHVVEEAERVARKFRKSRREILIAAGLTSRAARTRNPCNMFKRWYAHNNPNNTGSEYSRSLPRTWLMM